MSSPHRDMSSTHFSSSLPEMAPFQQSFPKRRRYDIGYEEVPGHVGTGTNKRFCDDSDRTQHSQQVAFSAYAGGCSSSSSGERSFPGTSSFAKMGGTDSTKDSLIASIQANFQQEIFKCHEEIKRLQTESNATKQIHAENRTLHEENKILKKAVAVCIISC